MESCDGFIARSELVDVLQEICANFTTNYCLSLSQSHLRTEIEANPGSKLTETSTFQSKNMKKTQEIRTQYDSSSEH